jgi:hypothetical protein
MAEFRSLGTDLINTKVWPLELGSTILFFYGQVEDWDAALQNACAFKNVQPTAQPSLDALALAKRVHAARVN